MKQVQTKNYQLMTVQEAATYTGLAIKTLYTMVSQRRIPFVKIGGALRFDKEQVNAWLDQQTVMPMHGK